MIEIPLRYSKAGELLQYATVLSGGMDLFADIKAYIALNSLERKFIPTAGLSIAFPEGYEAQVRPRSRLASKPGTTNINTLGTDADYCGDIGPICHREMASHRCASRIGDRHWRVGEYEQKINVK